MLPALPGTLHISFSYGVDMKIRLCVACGQEFRPSPQVPQQCFCSAKECQRERRRRWQRDKMRSDPDYQDNQKRAQHAWNKRNPDYWRKYREAHPEYAQRNQTMQHERNQGAIAKMDVSTPPLPMPSGIYRLIPIGPADFAKMDSWTVEIILLSSVSVQQTKNCKEMT